LFSRLSHTFSLRIDIQAIVTIDDKLTGFARQFCIRSEREVTSMKADQKSSVKSREVTLQKRSLIIAAAFIALVTLVVPALAFATVGPTGPGVQGFRADFTKSTVCAGCHTTGSFGAPIVQARWAGTKHGTVSTAGQESRAPSSYCAGCHVSNYDPTKATPVASPYTLPSATSATPSPTPTATKTAWVYPYTTAVPSDTTSPYPFSEAGIGCSSCHYGDSVGGGNDTNDTAHNAPYSQFANADICGQCHSRYSYTDQAYTVPYASPTAGAPAEMIVQMQNAVGYQMLGNPGNSFIADPLENTLHIQSPGWTPTPVPSTTATPAYPGSAAGVMTYWQDASGNNMVWQNRGHDGSAAQYPEWAGSLHANSLSDLKAAVPVQFISNSCLKCHSADYQITQAAGKTTPNAAQAQYGDTCVSCHTPHDAGKTNGVWDPAFDTQLVGNPDNPSDLCTTCHVAQSETGAEITASNEAVPGTTMYNDQKQIMAGVGAIDVPNMPGVHEGKCVDCHMPPTSWSRGSVQLGGNHTMKIIDPKVAASASPIPVATVTPSPWATSSATPSPATSVVNGVMPFSACSTCHGRSSDPLATYLSDTITQRKAQMHAWDDQAVSELTAAAVRLGYTDIGAANTAINGKAMSSWTADELAFQKSFTNKSFVEKEGSWGVHNYQYASAIIKTAIDEAKSVRLKIDSISIMASPGTVTSGSPVTISGSLVVTDPTSLWTGGQVAIYRQNTGSSVKALVGTVWLSGLDAKDYTFTQSPVRPATYWATFLGNTSFGTITTSTVAVSVNYKVTLKASKSTTTAGTTLKFTGAVTPGVPAGTVTIQRKVGTAWKTWATKVMTTGTFSISKKMARGTYLLRATFPAAAPFGAGVSKQIKVVVR
jgi:mono/diheme cytochrome c family protein